MSESDRALEQVVEYMKSHWPSQVKPEWQVSIEEYPNIVAKVIADFSVNKTKNCKLFRIAGLSGSGKTTQILPAVEAHCQMNRLDPILIAARCFVEHHPHYQEIKDFYGEEKLRQMTDEFSTIMMFLTLSKLIEAGYDIILDVTLLDPKIEAILLKMLEAKNYDLLILMIAISPVSPTDCVPDRANR